MQASKGCACPGGWVQGGAAAACRRQQGVRRRAAPSTRGRMCAARWCCQQAKSLPSCTALVPPPLPKPTFAASAAVVAAAATTLRVAARRCAGRVRRQPITRCADMLLLRLLRPAARCGALLGHAVACSILAGVAALRIGTRALQVPRLKRNRSHADTLVAPRAQHSTLPLSNRFTRPSSFTLPFALRIHRPKASPRPRS